MKLTVDTSAVMAVILNEPSKARLLHLAEIAELLAPPTLPWEVGNALSALFKRGRLGLEAGRAALESYEMIAVRLADIDVLDAVQIAAEQRIHAYDAYALACARRYRTPLLSLDTVQCDVARGMGIEVMETRP